MAAEDKIEPRFQRMIEHQRVRAAQGGASAGAADETPFEVTISHQERLIARPRASLSSSVRRPLTDS